MLLRQMVMACQKAFQFSLLPNHLKLKRQYKKLKHKDILTLAEAAFYLGKDTGTVVEEVGLGKLPGGKLDGQWHFSN